MEQLEISCLVYGSHDIFTIDIKPEARFSQLQELILDKVKLSPVGLEWHHLMLWKVPFSDDDSLDDIQLKDGVGGVTRLTARNVKRIGSAIKLEDVGTHLIVIQPPPKLWCWVRGRSIDSAFELQPLPYYKVSDLRKAIKEEMKPLLDGVPASDLVLWKVEIDRTQDFEGGLAGGRKLRYDEEIQSIFPEPVPGNYLSIVIDAGNLFRSGSKLFYMTRFPVNSLHLYSRISVLSFWVSFNKLLSPPAIDDALQSPEGLVDRVKMRRDIALERKEKHKGPPSTLGTPVEFEKIQASDKTYFGCARPPKREPPLPLSLLHPVFGAFADDCKNVTLTADDYEFARNLRQEMCSFFSDENTRRNYLCQLLDKFGLKVTPGNIGSLKELTDGHSVEGDHPIYIQELKNELTTGGAEPSFQALLYYQSFIDAFQLDDNPSTCHPCFITYVLGPHIAFAGAALTDRANFEVFALVPLNIHTTNDEAFESITRHWVALKRALDSLRVYYRELDAQTLFPIIRSGPYFPYATSFNHLHDNTASSLTYKGNLAGRDLVFEASIDEGKKLVCIKFVRHYGAQVHHWCATRGIAPELLGFQRLAGGWYIVVMELLQNPWELLWESKRYVTFSPSEELKDQLRDALVEMHQQHMVHGDIRDTNIMIDMASNPPFKLLDFDWAGKAGEVKYPKFINRQAELRRPEGVEDGRVILPGHDDAMVESVF